MQVLVAVLHHGQDVADHLGGVELVGQAVPHRHAGVLAQDLHQLLAEAAVFDAIVHAPQHPGGVFHRLFVADLRAARPQVGDIGALVVGCHFEGAARAGGGLFEDQGDVLALQPLLLVAAVLGRFEVGGQLEQELQLVGGEVELFEKVAVA